jgi:hypothetical protein
VIDGVAEIAAYCLIDAPAKHIRERFGSRISGTVFENTLARLTFSVLAERPVKREFRPCSERRKRMRGEPNKKKAPRANSRKRRTKLNFRARAGHRARTVTPPAKTPAVQVLTICNVPSDILETIDELAARQDRSRSSLVRRELERIVAENKAKQALSKSR